MKYYLIITYIIIKISCSNLTMEKDTTALEHYNDSIVLILNNDMFIYVKRINNETNYIFSSGKCEIKDSICILNSYDTTMNHILNNHFCIIDSIQNLDSLAEIRFYKFQNKSIVIPNDYRTYNCNKLN